MLHSYEQGGEKKEDQDKPTIIVVGAGMAGISASISLLEKGFKVKLVEAQAEAGGRAQNVRSPSDVSYPLGPMYIHGVGAGFNDFEGKKNPVLELLDKYGIPHQKINDYDVSALNIQAAAEIDHEELQEQFMEYSADPFLHKRAPDAKTASEKLALRLAEASIQGSSGVTIAESRKSADLGQGSGFKGGDHLLDPKSGGYQKLMQMMVEDLKKNPDFQFVNNSEVTSIETVMDWKETTARVGVKNGPSLIGNGVVCTLPLGVLKSGTVKIPELLANKKMKETLDSFQIARQNKVFLEFDKPFWAKGGTEPDVIQCVSDDPNFPALISFVNLHKFSGGKVNGLIASYYADDALFKGKNDQQIAQETLARLKKAYPNMPALRYTYVTHLEKNQYAQGCWSRLGEASSSWGVIGLDVPVGTKEWPPKFNLVLAGEHIAPTGCRGTVHGAYISGQTAAAKLEEYLKPQKGDEAKPGGSPNPL